MKNRYQPVVAGQERLREFPVLLLVKVCVAVGLDRGRHVDRLAEVGRLEVQSCAVIPEAGLGKDSIDSLPAVIADLAHDVCCDADLYAVKLRALKE